ncbi:GDSL-type esterase/lipase family protein [Planococcus sp. N028]|uniref:GDSL-type esterase/lipase family protein n=1 Tax=Planococcus shixiaomingii TaxID=3058393 RepID=A0ABT8MZ61_9BACL|nr:GDSL-type esterase/lipase family protein [Planococcus sp. N028]MDN7240929.1 GDSL-type esterase/lipase family protein [Planococcus sp. N028]
MSKLFRVLFVLLMALSLPLTTAFAHNDHGKHHDKDILVALGDSVPFGFSPHRNNERPAKYAFPYLMGDKADLKVYNFAVPIWKTEDLLAALDENKKFRQAVRKADYVTVNIGGIDFLEILQEAKVESRGDSKKFLQLLEQKLAKTDVFDDLREILKEIRSLTDAPVVLYNIYNPFQSKDPFHKVAEHYLPQINAVYENLADDFKNIELADAYKAFDDSQAKFVIRGDVHPTKAGHVKLAKIGLRALDLDHARHQHHHH